jgi:putative SOS response-associated peptidase YedK
MWRRPKPPWHGISFPAGRVLVPAQWGLVPHWVKSASDAKLRAPKLVNAKSDTASTGTAVS